MAGYRTPHKIIIIMIKMFGRDCSSTRSQQVDAYASKMEVTFVGREEETFAAPVTSPPVKVMDPQLITYVHSVWSIRRFPADIKGLTQQYLPYIQSCRAEVN